jgi:preprotein translocase subunit SecE
MPKISQKIKTFFEEVITESKKVDWPRRKENLNYTLIVLGISFGVALFLGVLDFIFTKILEILIF